MAQESDSTATRTDGERCRLCRHAPPQIPLYASGWHEGPLRAMLLEAKWRHSRLATEQLLHWLATTCARERLGQQFDVICPVSRDLWRRVRYGVPLAVILAEALAKQTGLRLGRAPRRRIRRAQVGQTRDHRQAQLRGCFHMPARAAASWSGQRVLIVDDVWTTGATAEELARCLQRAGAQSVAVLVVAITPP